MKNNSNVMILNDVNIGISKIELNKSDLRITDMSRKYCLKVCVEFNWQDINKIKIGTKEEVDFNEYCLSENNESALIWPSIGYVQKLSADSLCFHFEFKNLADTAHYMNERGHFDIELKSLNVTVFVNYSDAINNGVIYVLK